MGVNRIRIFLSPVNFFNEMGLGYRYNIQKNHKLHYEWNEAIRRFYNLWRIASHSEFLCTVNTCKLYWLDVVGYFQRYFSRNIIGSSYSSTKEMLFKSESITILTTTICAILLNILSYHFLIRLHFGWWIFILFYLVLCFLVLENSSFNLVLLFLSFH